MTKQDILNEVATSQSQQEFSFTNDLDAVVDSILKPHEDYFLELHDKVIGIIMRECLFRDSDETRHVAITFADVSNWQKELFMYKKDKIEDLVSLIQYGDRANLYNSYKAQNLPNQHINLGLRDTNVQVGKWTPPAPMFLEDLKEMCFPLSLDGFREYYGLSLDTTLNEDLQNNNVLLYLNNWYKTFKLCYFFEDFNEELSNIVINIFSYILTGKYLIK